MWQGLHGHDDIAERFRRTLGRGRLASTYLFVGPPGVGKRQFAIRLAGALLCRQTPDDSLDCCGQCESCRYAAAGNHPDLETVSLPADKSTLPIDLFVGDREHRHQVGLCHNLALKPYLGGRRIAIIDDADHFSNESANCLLKTLEEPPPRSLLILIGTTSSKQLPTIRSRAQLVSFRPLPVEVVAELLVTTGVVEDRQQAASLAAHSGGSIERASELAEPELWQFRQQLLGWLAEPQLDSVRAAAAVKGFIDAAGKEAAARRRRLRAVVQFAVDFYREVMREGFGSSRPGDQELAQAVTAVCKHAGGHPLLAADRIDHCLTTLEQLARNANQATLVHCWLEGLARPGVAR